MLHFEHNYFYDGFQPFSLWEHDMTVYSPQPCCGTHFSVRDAVSSTFTCSDALQSLTICPVKAAKLFERGFKGLKNPKTLQKPAKLSAKIAPVSSVPLVKRQTNQPHQAEHTSYLDSPISFSESLSWGFKPEGALKPFKRPQITIKSAITLRKPAAKAPEGVC